ncbi:hypothetical protein BURMUCF1_A0486 [Burkholderia multivorans ATCC BAA-247]|uniref:DUF4123 domain-containing protein n=1 Tax=Burkholderia multivorans TaxID=87883 RepID=UPI000277CC28|nr:DUF4123 domain-containing protein [Burkholderia multivorans]EJO60373.1 hypothetical protein BURMUCF1_A0486 [Burkholderia multivorans ATCC BAA-247]
MKTADDNGKLYGLADGAQYPEALATWVLEFSPEVRSLFEGLPEEEAGHAAPILFEIDDAHSEWVRHVDLMDRYRPCFTVMRSALDIDGLKIHFQRFLLRTSAKACRFCFAGSIHARFRRLWMSSAKQRALNSCTR